jgi:hypothetical protein
MRHLALVFALALAACKGDDTDTDVIETDSPVETDETDIDTEDTDDTDDTDVEIDTDAVCWVDSDVGECWDCDLPSEPEDDSLKALNQCSDVTSVEFDNAARIPASTWQPGDPLPPI